MRFFAAIALRGRSAVDWLQGDGLPTALTATIGMSAFLLRLYGLGDKPFWLDEVASLRRATANIPELVADSLHNNHYPSYFLLLWLVAKLGTSQWLLRLPSAVCGALAAALTAAIGLRIAGRRAGVVAGLLMAFSPFEVQFGQEARSYTLVACLILTALWGLLCLAQQPASAALPFKGNGALRGAWVAYGLGTALALAVLNVAIPWFVAANLGAIVIARAAGEQKWGFWRNWVFIQLVILGAWAPLVAAVYVASKGAVLDGVAWAPAETSKTIWSIVKSVYLLRISNFITISLAPVVVPGLSLAVAVLAALGVWRMRREPTVLVVLGCAAVVLPLGLCLVSLFVPVLVPRYFAWSAAPFFIFAGAGLSLLSGVRFAALATALGAVCLINLIPYYGYETKPRWDLVATKLAAIAHPGDVVLVNSYYGYSVLSVFAARAGFDQRHVKLTWLLPEAAKIPPTGEVWAVYGRSGQATKRSPEDFRRSLSIALGGPVAVNEIGRYILLWRFRKPKSPELDAPAGGYCRIEEQHR
jgi:mannosyltransferase